MGNKFNYSRPDLVQRFEDWWKHDNKGLPLMRVIAGTGAPEEPLPPYNDVAERYTSAWRKIESQRRFDAAHVYLGDSFSGLSANYGPGSLALYLGAEPIFAPSTVWYRPCISDPETYPPLRFDPENKWWRSHFELYEQLKRECGDAIRLEIPDLIENIDIYAAMRDPQEALYDIMDIPEKVEEFIAQIDGVYFKYYDRFYDLCVDGEGVSSYTVFAILGYGRVAKIQCDFSAMLSPAQFRRFVQPSLDKQSRRLDHVLYHLDGPDAIRHVPALMEIEGIDALQWTSGAGHFDAASDEWFVIYDQVVAANKSLWLQILDGGVDDWIRSSEKLMNRYDKRLLYFLYPTMSMSDAEKLLSHAEKHWN